MILEILSFITSFLSEIDLNDLFNCCAFMSETTLGE